MRELIVGNAEMSAIAKAVYAFSGEGQTVPLPLAESVVVLVAEQNKDGWCRGFSGGREGWFPASYVKDIPQSTLTNVSVRGVYIGRLSNSH